MKSQQVFRSNEDNVFTEGVNNVALSANEDEWIQSIDLIETDAYGISKDVICKKEKSNCKNFLFIC